MQRSVFLEDPDAFVLYLRPFVAIGREDDTQSEMHSLLKF